jgi:hypothetical protein
VAITAHSEELGLKVCDADMCNRVELDDKHNRGD